MARLGFHHPRLVTTGRTLPLLGVAMVLTAFSACGGGGTDADGSGGMGGSSGGSDSGGSGGTNLDTSPHTYAATDERIQYVGRFDATLPERLVYSAPLSQITIRFRGTGVTALLEDEYRYNQRRNFYDVVLDGELHSKLHVPERLATEVLVVEGLSPGDHDLTLIKRNEADNGKGMFSGFTVAGTLIDPAPLPERKLAFIGDSITAGSGAEADDGTDQCTENAFFEQENGWGQPYHNANASYAAVAGRLLEAQVHITAVSGIGLLRNYTSVYDVRTMPQVYDLIFVERDRTGANPPNGDDGGYGLGGGGEGGMGGAGSYFDTDPRWIWDTERFVPDAVVVALGTNDFSPGDTLPLGSRPNMDVDAWTDAYVRFVDRLKGYYPSAHVFALQSPMLGDGWPDSEDTFRSDQWAGIQAVVSHYADLGDDTVHALPGEKFAGSGCGTHPSSAQHAEIGEAVATAIKGAMGW